MLDFGDDPCPRTADLVVRSTRPDDLATVIRLHRELLSHGLFPRLGTAFMLCYHRTFMDLDSGISLVAVMTAPHGGEEVIGFVCGSTDQRRHVAEVLATARWPLLIPGLAGLLRRPRLLMTFARTRLVRYLRRLLRQPVRRTFVSRLEREPVAVLSAVAVSATARAGGVGAALVAGLVRLARQAGTDVIELVTLAGPRGAATFYRSLGWTEVDTHQDKDGYPVITFRMELARGGR